MNIDGRAPRLLGDERGAVLLIGVFMCACMVGMLWYVAGIGDAIFYRERMQEASDASAFSAAVLHARGMNLIVLLNLIMACVLGLRVAMRAIQAGLYVASALFLLIPVYGVGLSGAALRGADAMDKAVRASKPAIDGTLRGLSAAQKGIAVVVPGAAIAGSYQVGAKYQPLVAASAAGNPLELKGLPVEEGTTDKLCNEAGRTVMEIVDWLVPLPIPDAFMDQAEKAVGKTVEKGKIYFCFGQGEPPDLREQVDEEVGKQCDQERDDLARKAGQAESAYRTACQRAGAACDSSSPDQAKLTQAQRDELLRLQVAQNSARSASTSFDGKRCREQKKAQTDERMRRANESAAGSDASSPNTGRDANNQDPQGKNPRGGKPGASNTEGMTPKKVIPDYRNGANSAQMLAVTIGDETLLSVSPVGVQAGAWNGGEEITIPPAARFAIAQAEFFYDCKGLWASKACNDDKGGGEEAMWHLKWRARLRRYNAPFTRSSNVLMARLSDLLVQLQYSAQVMKLSEPTSLANMDAVHALRAIARDPIIH